MIYIQLIMKYQDLFITQVDYLNGGQGFMKAIGFPLDKQL